MRALLIRHGKTPGNEERRYIGSTDERLSAAGKRECEQAETDFSVKTVYVSPLLRARETAAILFPCGEQRVIPDLRETDFGVFEGRNADEMADDAEYRAWVDGMCLGPCPGGESREEVTRRASEAFAGILTAHAESAADQEEGPLVFVIHGGVIMSILSALALPKQDYYDYAVPTLGGWDAACRLEDGKVVLYDLKRIHRGRKKEEP